MNNSISCCKKLVAFFLCLTLGIFFADAAKKTKFLQDYKLTSTIKTNKDEVFVVAQKLEVEEMKRAREREKIAEEERRKKEQLAKERWLEALRKRLEKDRRELIRKARRIEKKRIKTFRAWRNFTSNRKAAASLVRAIKSISLDNKRHISALLEEVCEFRDSRLRGNLKNYPELEEFVKSNPLPEAGDMLLDLSL